MIITCPACDRRYLVEDYALGEHGRDLRCAVCGHGWFQELQPLNSVDFSPLDAVYPELDDAQPSFLKRIFRWGLVLGILSALLSGIYLKREKITEMYPPAAYIFETLGIPIKTAHLDIIITHLLPTRVKIDHEDYFVLKGEIKNPTDSVHQIPSLQVTLLGSCERATLFSKIRTKLKGVERWCILDQWQHKWFETRLPPGETLAFEISPRKILAPIEDMLVELS